MPLRRLLIAPLILLACAGRAPVELPAPSLQVETFEHAWSRVGEAFPDPEMNGVDWSTVRQELLPRAEAAETAADLRPVLTEMLARLDASHYAVVPGEMFAEGDPDGGIVSAGPGVVGVEPAWVEGAVRALRVGEGAREAGLTPGWELVAVGALDVRALTTRIQAEIADDQLREVLLCAQVQAALSGLPGDTLEVTAEARGELRTFSLPLTEATGVPAQLGHLPEVSVDFAARELPESGIGLVRFNAFMMPVPQRFGEAIGALRLGPGLILDLRGNPGGMINIARGVAGYLMAEPGSLGQMITREATLTLAVHPRLPEQRFEGPVAILLDGRSGSTAEILAAGLQESGRARVFGETSAGMALPSVFESLPNGDRLQFAFADLTTPEGVRIEGVGVAPDTLAPPTAEGLLAGGDPALDAALAWILSETGGALE